MKQTNENWLKAMQKANEDYRRTIREAIRTALFQLMKEKEFDKIRITELVETAGVSRSAFYRNYNSLNDVVNDELISFCHDVNETLDFSGDTYLRDILNAMNERREQLAIIISAGMENRLLDSLNSLFREEDLKYRVGYYIWTGIIYNIAMEWEKGNLGNDLDKIIEIVYHATKPMAEQLPGSIRDL